MWYGHMLLAKLASTVTYVNTSVPRSRLPYQYIIVPIQCLRSLLVRTITKLLTLWLATRAGTRNVRLINTLTAKFVFYQLAYVYLKLPKIELRRTTFIGVHCKSKLFKGVSLGLLVDYPWFCAQPYLENNQAFTVLLGLTIEPFQFYAQNLYWIRNWFWIRKMMTVLITALLQLVMKSYNKYSLN